MTETKFGKAFKDYRETIITAINWIIGLLIGEIGLVLGLNYLQFLWLIILQLAFAIFAILLATVIMYVIVSQASMELFSARLAIEDPKMSNEEYKNKYFEKHGRILTFLTDLVIDYDLYKWLFLLFFLETICLFTIIVLHLVK
ncbi:hypothetical protein LJE86_01095 [bacterium BMS3Abin03]|jgi:hypothetical protein|nr:hypothetical protein [bacterium BMS3Abin03]MCG6958609.1 hypothetical protein [bacterium BMS3Abin03]